ncbi:NUDIX hydrolase [Mycetocola spongiae]|uniref:NUDIX hydrolase n=1 Tax=Mycetocola spongiae TaxID=2859226 RepID=UPI001CF32BD9|nr:NUDIX domain-containing protein [Mycetocola spongiae]UCR88183.1 NUDIX domain-containing protein [Mycetocola spongiae]
MTQSALPHIPVAALAFIRDRRMLMVTARGRDVIYLPGGKIDAGESAREAVIREVREEVGAELIPETLHEYFDLALQAHGEPEGRLVEMRVFRGELATEPTPSSEVSALHWASTADAPRCPPAGAAVLARLFADGLID